MAGRTKAPKAARRIVPPTDLLEQVAGIEESLQRGRKLGAAGWAALGLSLAQGAVAFYAKMASVSSPQWVEQLVAVGAVVSLGLFFALTNWTRFWVRESQQPFRYTYSISDFEPVGKMAPSRSLHWLRMDLARRLSERIGRLSRLDEVGAPRADEPISHSHIDIRGTYGIREESAAETRYEVLAWIRVGAPDRPATLAHPVTFPLRAEALKHEDYQKLVERVYFSIATEIYKQIREDVERKINLLPLRSFRGAAYFHEAEDYVRSNTLESHDDAMQLYLNVIRIYDPDWFALPESLPLRIEKLGVRARALATRGLAIGASHFWPPLARNQLMIARAYIGYTTVLMYRRILAGLSGQRLNPVFEARPAIERALDRLRWLPDQVPGKRAAFFDALVAQALVRDELDFPAFALEALEDARRREPLRADQDARWLFVRGYIEVDPLQRLQFLRRAVEIDQRFEVAQYELARGSDHRWRTRPTLEDKTADIAFAEYNTVHDLNPGNVAAWANHAFMQWLLKDLSEAESLYKRGLEYKEIKRATFVAQLDAGLARIMAERGEVVKAYRHYIDATSATLAVGVAHGATGDPEFSRITPSMMRRFEDYLGTVEKHKERQVVAHRATPRLINSVYAFVLTDYGRASYQYYLETADDKYLKQAKEAFEHARSKELGGRYVMPHYYSHQLDRWMDPDYEGGHIRRAQELDENWVAGNLAFLLHGASRRTGLQKRIQEKRDAANEHRSAAESYRDKAREAFDRDLRHVAESAGSTSAEFSANWRSFSPTSLGTEELAMFEAEAEREELKAKDEDAEAERLSELLDYFDRTSVRLIRKLLPHAWLWKDGFRDHRILLKLIRKARMLPWLPNGDAFDGSVFRKSRYVRELRWEREFDNVHARALYAWSSWREDKLRRTALRHLGRHYWAADPDLLVDVLELSHGTKAWRECQQTMRSLVESWITYDTAYWSLSWLCPSQPWLKVFSEEEAANKLVEAWQRWSHPPSLALWIGEQLHELGNNTRAREVYAEATKNSASASRPDLLLDAGDKLRSLGDWELAEQAYRRALRALGAGSNDNKLALRGHLGAALSLWALPSEERALRELSLAAAFEVDVNGWRKWFVSEAVPEGGPSEAADGVALWRLHAWLVRQLRTHRLGPASVRDDCQDALLEFRRRVTKYSHDEQNLVIESRLPLVTPIRLDADPAFFPEGAETPGVKTLLDATGIDRVRGEMRERYGVKVPDVRIRADYRLSSGAYEILINEVPVRWDRTNPAQPWANCMLDALRIAIRRHLDQFLGLEEVASLLAGLEPRYAEVQGRALPDVAAICRFTQLLQLMITQGVSVANLPPILQSFSRWRSANLGTIAERARANLDPHLLGLRGDITLVHLSAELEQRLQHRSGTNLNGSEAALTDDHLAAVRSRLIELADAEGPHPVLVARWPNNRPILSQIAANIDADIPVLSAVEVSRSGHSEPLDYLELP